jgi:hypothetical protein
VGVLDGAGGRPACFDTPNFLLTGSRRDYDVPGMVQLLKALSKNTHVFIERQQARPEAGSASVFKVGVGYGLWLGILATLGLPHTVVSPQVWQREMYLGAVNAEGKDRSLLVASRLWPNFHIPRSRHDWADALLIAEYGRRVCWKESQEWTEVLT